MRNRVNKKYEQDYEKVRAAFDVLRGHYGSHKKASEALGVPLRTYAGWRSNGVPSGFEESVLIERAARISDLSKDAHPGGNTVQEATVSPPGIGSL